MATPNQSACSCEHPSGRIPMGFHARRYHARIIQLSQKATPITCSVFNQWFAQKLSAGMPDNSRTSEYLYFARHATIGNSQPAHRDSVTLEPAGFSISSTPTYQTGRQRELLPQFSLTAAAACCHSIGVDLFLPLMRAVDYKAGAALAAARAVLTPDHTPGFPPRNPNPNVPGQASRSGAEAPSQGPSWTRRGRALRRRPVHLALQPELLRLELLDLRTRCISARGTTPA